MQPQFRDLTHMQKMTILYLNYSVNLHSSIFLLILFNNKDPFTLTARSRNCIKVCGITNGPLFVCISLYFIVGAGKWGALTA